MAIGISKLAPLMLAAFLAGCGGGDGASAPPGGTSTTTVGTISGFGSVIVNGIRFETGSAAVEINGQAGTVAQLKVGMVVAVEGVVQDCPDIGVSVCSGIASRIRFRNNLEGPITTVNRLTNTIQVMGRLIELDPTTVVEGGTAGDITGLAVGDVVSISGYEQPDRIRAQLVERTGSYVPGTTQVQLQGTVANVDPAQGTCTVDGVPVGYGGLAAADLPPGGMANGQLVEVSGSGYANGLVTADRIQLRDRISYPDATLVAVEGYVSNFVSVSSFTVDGQAVDASSAVFLNGTATDLKTGAKVLVEGTMSGTLLLASKVTFRLEANAQASSVEIVAPIQSKQAASGSFTVLGQTIATTALTQFIDRQTTPSGPLRTMGYADLQVGDRVDVMAYRDKTGALVATRVERTDADPVLIVRGPVDSKTPVTAMKLVGVDVATGASTRYRDADGNLITDAAFYALVQVPPAVPTVVRAQGVASASSSSAIDATRTVSTRGEVEIAQ